MANKYTAMEVPDRELLEDLYFNRNMSQEEVGKHLGVSQKVIYSWFKKLGIKSRVACKRDQRGEKNHSWKGNDATYAALHYRVESARGKPSVCMACGSMDKSIYEWCNLTGGYEDINDYMRMCRKCHRQYDKNRKQSSKHVKTRAK